MSFCICKKILFFLTIFILFLVLQLRPESKSDSFRGLWITRDNLVSKEKIDGVINTAFEKGFNNLVIQVRGRGDAYYKSRIVPIAEEIKNSIEVFDPLQYFIEEAHKKNIKVHCWFNVFLLWSSPREPESKNHLYFKKPQWFCIPHNLLDNGAENFQTPADIIYISPGIDEVQNYLLKVIEEVVDNYSVDGVHLDYVRYPGENFGYNEILRNKFLLLNKIDPIELIRNQEYVMKKIGEKAFYNLVQEWNNFRGEQINIFVQNIKGIVKQRDSSTILSAAVVPDLNRAKSVFYQFWSDWVNRKFVDFVMPMNYVISSDDFKNNIIKMLEYVPKERIIMGFSAVNQSKYKLASKVFLTKSMGIEKFCIFSYDSIKYSNDIIDLF